MMIRQLVIGCILIGLAGLAQAATIVVTTHLDIVDNNGLCSLREAMLNAENANQSGSTDCAAGSISGNMIVFDEALMGSTIQLDGQALPTISRTLEIVGPDRGNPAALTISAEAASRIFVVDGADEVLIADLSLLFGRTFSDSEPGSTIHVANTPLMRLERLSVEGGIAQGADNHGGAIALFDSTVIIEESFFQGNQAGGGGGVIFSSNSKLEIVSTFMGMNVAVGRGGAIHAIDGDVTINASQIGGHTTTGSSAFGGALFMDGADLLLLNADLIGNITTGANAHGGAVYLRNAELSVVGGRIESNSAQGSGANGGGISTFNASTNLSGGCEILDNTTQQANGWGGAMRIGDGSLAMNNCLVSGNQTFGDSAHGGGIYVINGNATISQSQIISNQTHGDSAQGGGVRVRDGQLMMTDSLIQNNVTHGSGARGGGVYHRNGDSQLESLTVTGNSTMGSNAHGGGLYFLESSLLLQDVQVKNNQTSDNGVGAGLALYAGSYHIERSTISGNQGTANGGGLFVSDSDLWMLNSTISGNQLTAGTGSGLFGTRSKLDLFHVTAAGNINPPGMLSHLFVTGSDSDHGFLNLYNSLVINNRCGSGEFGDVSGTGNIGTHDSCPALVVPTADAIELEALTDNGGATPTHAIGQGSLAINAAGNCAMAIGVDEDQRGAVRPGGSSSACDVGAYETDQPPAPVDLTVALSIDPLVAAAGEQVDIVIDVSNQSDTWASEVEAQIDLGSALIFQDADYNSGMFNAVTGVWTIGLLGPDDKLTLTLTVELATSGGRDVALSVSGFQPDPESGNNQVSGEVLEPPPPTSIVVNTLRGYSDDDGLCSLREAMINANNANQSGSLHCASGSLGLNTIEFHPDLIGGTIELLEALPAVATDMAIVGPGSGPGSLTIDAMGSFRLFDMSQPRHFQLQDLTLTGGRTTGSGHPGAGLRAINGTTVILEQVRFADNVAESSSGGAIIFTGISLSIIDSEFVDNQAGGVGVGGGGIRASNGAQILIERTSFISNEARQGGAIDLNNGAALHMVNSTISSNRSDLSGAGINVNQSHARLTHSTVAFNEAGSPGPDISLGQGINLLGATDNPATLELENSLIVQADSEQVTCRMGNTHTSIVSVGSFSTHASCTDTATAAAAIGLLPLADNGGPTLTHALSPSSVAIGAAGNCGVDFDVTSDQRGLPRPGGASVACDVGAYEQQGIIIDRIFQNRFESSH